jgi:hypothetical protein
MPDRTGVRGWGTLGALVAIAALLSVVVFAAWRATQGPAVQPTGSTPPPNAVTPAGPVSYIVGTATAGPYCPVERIPPASECAPRPVVGAVIVATYPGQGEVARATTAPDGSYRIELHGYGTYTVIALPVPSVMNAPAPVTVSLEPMSTKRVDFQYDTGIR